MRAAFTERLSGTLAWYKSRIESESNSAYNLQPSDTVTLRPLPQQPSPYTFGDMSYLSEPFQSFDLYKSPSVTELMVPSLTFNYEGDGFDLQSTTSYIDDDSTSTSYDTTFVSLFHGVAAAPGGVADSIGVPYSPYVTDLLPFSTHSFREGWAQEFRFTTKGDGPWSVVAGLYGATFKLTTHAYQMGSFDTYFTPTVGASPFGDPYYANTPLGYGALAAGQTNRVKDDEVAIYGEATYRASPKLSFTGGVRVSKVKTAYNWRADGQLLAAFGTVGVATTDPNHWRNTGPTLANGGLGGGTQENTPVTPKAQVQYKFTEDRILYALAAKAFRPGGSNQVPISAVCPGLAQLAPAITTASQLHAATAAYGPDTVWSYEIGAKMRITPKVQWNASVFRIDWKDIQVDAGITCGQSRTVNAGKAISQGFDTELFAVFGRFTANMSAGYNSAYYAETSYGIKNADGTPLTQTPAVQKGDRIPVPVWTGNVGLNYGFNITGDTKGYARADHQYQGKYENSPRAGVGTYAPDIRLTPAARQTNVRVGAIMGQFDVSLFANNVFNDLPDLGIAGGRTVCAIATGAACSSYTTYNPFYTKATFRPRTYGLQVVYRL